MALLSKSNNSPTSTITKSSFKHALLLMFLIILNFTPSQASDVVFLRENCTTNETFTANSTFHNNLRTLLSSLRSKATENAEFYNTTVLGKSPFDTVYGLFMCRGDVPPELCQECVANATQRLGGGQGSDTCPFAKGAIIWYDECMVRYSNTNFFSKVDTRPRMRLRNTANVSDPESFMRLLYKILNETADVAASSSNGAKAYAIKQAEISGFQTLYCLAQCTPDLSPRDCRRCLSGVIGDLPWCCPGKQGGRVLYPSCNFRYELYPFYRTASLAPVFSPEGLDAPSNAAKGKGKAKDCKNFLSVLLLWIWFLLEEYLHI